MEGYAKHINALRKALGLAPFHGPNVSSETRRECVSDIASALSYCERIVGLFPELPRRLSREFVDDFHRSLYAWSDFWTGAVNGFMDALEEATIGLRDFNRFRFPCHNVVAYLFDELGIGGEFKLPARAWSTADREVALRATAKAQRRMTFILSEMRSDADLTDTKPPLNETDTAIAEVVFKHGPMLGKQIGDRLPAQLRVTTSQVRRIFSEKLIPFYGFSNPGDKRGYRAPPERTWRV